MRWSIPLILCLYSGIAHSQEVPLKVEGGGASVVTIIKRFPFYVAAPEGEAIYLWSFPVGVDAVDEGDKLRVNAAPEGALTVNVKAMTAYIEKDKIRYKTVLGSSTFTIATKEPKAEPRLERKKLADGDLRFFTFIGNTPVTSDVIDDKALRMRLDSAGVSVWVYQFNDGELEAKGLSKTVSDHGGWPCVILQSKGGHIIGSARITTLAAMNEYLDKFIGK